MYITVQNQRKCKVTDKHPVTEKKKSIISICFPLPQEPKESPNAKQNVHLVNSRIPVTESIRLHKGLSALNRERRHRNG